MIRKLNRKYSSVAEKICCVLYNAAAPAGYGRCIARLTMVQYSNNAIEIMTCEKIFHQGAVLKSMLCRLFRPRYEYVPRTGEARMRDAAGWVRLQAVSSNHKALVIQNRCERRSPNMDPHIHRRSHTSGYQAVSMSS